MGIKYNWTIFHKWTIYKSNVSHIQLSYDLSHFLMWTWTTLFACTTTTSNSSKPASDLDWQLMTHAGVYLWRCVLTWFTSLPQALMWCRDKAFSQKTSTHFSYIKFQCHTKGQRHLVSPKWGAQRPGASHQQIRSKLYNIFSWLSSKQRKRNTGLDGKIKQYILLLL